MKQKLLILLLFFSTILFAESGKNTIRGTVYDAKTNEVLSFVNVIIAGLQTGTSTDFDGMFILKIPDGKHQIEFKTMGYESVIKYIEVLGGKTLHLRIEMKESQQQLKEIVITSSYRTSTEMAMLNIKKKSLTVLDGLSAQAFKTSGISNLASAVKKIVGVSLQGGKYVYVRGLGDRYTKTILNKIDIPGLDPDKNTIQMDLFPTSILDNVLVYKSFSADLPADFTGGVINLITKDYPEEKQTSFSINIGYNPLMNFQSNFNTYKGGLFDFIAVDDGTYSMPISVHEKVPYTFENDSKLTDITKKFNPQMGVLTDKNLMNYGFSFYTGNRYSVGGKGNNIGYITSVSYKTKYSYNKNYINNIFEKNTDARITKLNPTKKQTGSLGKTNIILNVMGSFTFKTKYSKYKLNILHIRNGEKHSGLFNQHLSGSDFLSFKKHYLSYTQRNITNLLLSGKHMNADNNFKASWDLSVTKSGIYDKDVRSTPYQLENNTYSIAPNNQPRRIWRNLDEINYVAKTDFKKKYLAEKAKLMFGILGSYKSRDYSIYSYQIGIRGNSPLKGNGNELLQEKNIWTPQTDRGTYIVNQSVYNKSNLYNAKQINLSAYASNKYDLTKKLKTVIGLRLENFMLLYTGENTTGIKLYNDRVINKIDLFPSVNLTYVLNNTNLKLSYNKTTARPSFKEASIAEIYDPLSNMTFIGNIDLKPTYIQNIDFRCEFYDKKTDMFAMGMFYKYFKDPIELTFYQSAPSNYTPKNLGDAQVYGIEIEWRKGLGFISPALKHFNFNINASWIKSIMVMNDDEYQLRLNTAREGETAKKERSLQGQAPYLINSGLTYQNKKSGWTADISYNVQGETLAKVGAGIPDVYERAFNSLNFNLIKQFGKSKKSSITFKISNILNQNRVLVYKNFKAIPQYHSLQNLGRTFRLGYSIEF